jgi:hypothetical protein
MSQFCELASDVGRTVNLDGLIEDRDVEVIRGYGRSAIDGVLLNNGQQPTSSECSKTLIASATPLTIFNVYNYLLGCSEFDHAAWCDFHTMEAHKLTWLYSTSPQLTSLRFASTWFNSPQFALKAIWVMVPRATVFNAGLTNNDVKFTTHRSDSSKYDVETG